MKVSTKNKVLEVLNDHLRDSRQRKNAALKKLRSCEENIRWAKKNVAKYSQIVSHAQTFTKDYPQHMKNQMIDSISNTSRENRISLKRDRESLKNIRTEMSRAQNDIVKWNGLINEVSPYKK